MDCMSGLERIGAVGAHHVRVCCWEGTAARHVHLFEIGTARHAELDRCKTNTYAPGDR